MRRWSLLVLALALGSPRALANGRFPAANQLVVDPERLAVRSTFGLLVGPPSGPLAWVCEPGIGLVEDQDPPIALSLDHRILVAPLQGLRRSSPDACSFAPGLGLPSQELLLDVSSDRSSPARAFLLSWSPASRRTSVFFSDDGGNVWNFRGGPADTDPVPTTLDLAPSDPSRLVLAGSFSAQGALRGHVARSEDGGVTWARSEIPLEPGEKGLFLSAIDPADPLLVYARTSGGAQDRLLRSLDGGATFSELTRVDGAMLGFALAPDGAQVAIGGPSAGVLVAPRGSASFLQVRGAATSCLAWATDGLYACGSGVEGDFVVGRSPDGGLTWEPVLARLADLQGPTSRCDPSSPVAQTCEPLWPAQRQQLAAIDGGGAGGMAGAAGAAGGAGGAVQGGGPGGQALAGAAGARRGVDAPPGEASCGCIVTARPPGASAFGGALALAALCCRRRPASSARRVARLRRIPF
jgi:hypothetical protein